MAIPFVDFELAATVLNFGAFLAFMGVNLATIREYYFRRRDGKPGIVADLLVPGLGFLFCLAIWLSLPMPAKIAGGVWLLSDCYTMLSSRGAFAFGPCRSISAKDDEWLINERTNSTTALIRRRGSHLIPDARTRLQASRRLCQRVAA